MAKVTRTKYNVKKWNKVFGERPEFIELPKVVHTQEKRDMINRIYAQYLPTDY